MADGLTAAGLARLRAAAERHVGDERVPGLGTSWLVDPTHDLTMIVLTQRLFDTPGTPPVHRDIQAAAYAALA